MYITVSDSHMSDPVETGEPTQRNDDGRGASAMETDDDENVAAHTDVEQEPTERGEEIDYI
jgi:hypothetical protein